ncbi:bifunctional proline dehydrogenase/L-glutamate gamma-semialdehyde dehydrogenase PutA [Blastochloris viridis]|uniref:Bifunctional protein PutA n=1 Tax=Blastochloris viridis TaxID=1079 RepID=A0A0H5BFC5_BLAVI|nr:bifunctional proline dehydrogenase/L-glutamate gamma-semialdehyde dehydrogenase PutA [Blastochloris viridis]ALK09227.1 Bifunctional protein PutA [Blastochloris viridis]BAS00906.1 proline dehydrogenase [Blastochloris viridis]CUU41890.1 Bifunctional protein putA [Blastochloris viridis]
MTALPPFEAPFAAPDEDIAAGLLAAAALPNDAERRIDAEAAQLIAAIRKGAGGIGGVEDFLRAYALSTQEGLALMVLAEALLRVPDEATADRLIEDKLGRGHWGELEAHGQTVLVHASAWALGVTARLIQPGATPDSIVAALVKRLGLPAVRAATRQAMRLMGSHFVLGRTIGEALGRAATAERRGELFSFDMLGEGARTKEDAQRYFDAYANAIQTIGRNAGAAPLPARPGISIKLSALHPRYEAVSRDRVMAELVPRMLELARAARAHHLNCTVDAEEADRLELSLEVFASVLAAPELDGWTGFGLAVQAYSKRALAVIEHIDALAAALGRRLMVRLVKGAYWDSEIKRAQERGLADYPLFTRKAMTDLNFLACAKRLLNARPRLYPQFASHNALTVASVIELAGGVDGYEFQRLHGMGEAMYADLTARRPAAAVRVYAPVGGHADLLAYLVRRLLENGANSSFVAGAANPLVPISALLVRPQSWIARPERARHRRIPLPRDLYGHSRRNAAGVEFGHRAALDALLAEAAAGAVPAADAAPRIDGRPIPGTARLAVSPIDAETVVGTVIEADAAAAALAVDAAQRGFAAWAATKAELRAGALRRAADLLEAERGRAIALLQAEGGRTLDDALAEVREATDFLRYYAAEAERLFAAPLKLPGPTGEDNTLAFRGRGVFVCISPWNFPLAIFVGQIAAALAAGNAVVAKPAEQTPLIADFATSLLHRAGVPASALHLVPGDGEIGAHLVAHPLVAGVAVTGATSTARAINRALAMKDGPIVPLIAETGGINAMIVDATALPEQVTDDVVASAFRSAGQRCSALRLLCLQADVADKMLTMIAGAARELKVGDPRQPSTHVGPVIDAEAKARLERWIAAHAAAGRLVWRGTTPSGGHFVAPAIIALDSPEQLTEEVFGPVLHVVRWRAGNLDQLVDAIKSNGYGLTLGIHSRIDATVRRVIERLGVGNVYVNRNMIGAVVGSQPFGGSGLSGTGPKAGGPNYLPRFAQEQTVAVNTAAAGGNASLIATEDD